jgi:hypothetical protein
MVIYNTDRKSMLEHLLNGHYLRKTYNHHGNVIYKLYDAHHRPLAYVHKLCPQLEAALHIKSIHRSTGRLTLDLRAIRSTHGNTYLHQGYKHWRKAEKKAKGNRKTLVNAVTPQIPN